ncbi:MAG TPA: hypothetical protein VFB76_16720 [Candidatus Angelobacter sp.]|nr:hypothetical protein [Candidatus Angelobacter sp.]
MISTAFGTTLRVIAGCCCLAASMLANAECKNAQAADVPHGANETVELPQQKLHSLFGTVQLPGGKAADDIVVEVYRRLESKGGDDAREQTRLVACVTGNDGGFSFNDIKPGRYLLIVGTRKADGMNELYVPILLKKSWWRGKGSSLRLTLVIGT